MSRGWGALNSIEREAMRSVKGTSLVMACLLVACTIKPVSRMDAYLGTEPEGTKVYLEELLLQAGAPLEAGLFVVNDTSDRDSAPALTEQGRAFLRDQVKQRVHEGLPIQIIKDLSPPLVVNGQAPPEAVRIAREQGMSYVLLAVFSNAESEVPMRLPLDGDPEQGGGGRATTHGFEMRTNGLAELALIETGTGRVVARSEGRAWTKLNRLFMPIQANVYPVIRRSLRVAPIYPKEENAKDITRSLAGDEALEQAVMHLQKIWRRPARS